MQNATPFDQCLNDWYESQSEETLLDLAERFDAISPRQAWIAHFNDCPPLAQKAHSDGLAAHALRGPGVCS